MINSQVLLWVYLGFLTYFVLWFGRYCSLPLNIDHLQDGFTPVVAAVERHQVDVVKILCEKRADVEICNEKSAEKKCTEQDGKKHIINTKSQVELGES